MRTRQDFILSSIRRALENAIDDVGYRAVYVGVACEVFPDACSPADVSVVQPATSRQPLTFDQARQLAAIAWDLLEAINQFGYDTVYFGVGCQVFDRAITP